MFEIFFQNAKHAYNFEQYIHFWLLPTSYLCEEIPQLTLLLLLSTCSDAFAVVSVQILHHICVVAQRDQELYAMHVELHGQR